MREASAYVPSCPANAHARRMPGTTFLARNAESRGWLGIKPGHDALPRNELSIVTATHAPIPRATCRSASPSNRYSGRGPAGRPAWCSWWRAWMMAKSPRMRIFTSSAVQILDRYRHCGLLQERGAIDQRLVGIGAVEIRGKDFVKAFDVGILHGRDIVVVELCQLGDVVVHDFLRFLSSMQLRHAVLGERLISGAGERTKHVTCKRECDWRQEPLEIKDGSRQELFKVAGGASRRSRFRKTTGDITSNARRSRCLAKRQSTRNDNGRGAEAGHRRSQSREHGGC